MLNCVATTAPPPEKFSPHTPCMGRHSSQRLDDLLTHEATFPAQLAPQFVRTQSELRQWLTMHRRRLQAGDAIPTIKEVAEFAGLSRQTIYEIARGTHVSEPVQRRLSTAVNRLDQMMSRQSQPVGRRPLTLHVHVSRNGPGFSFGRRR